MSAELYTLPGVEIFASGRYRQKVWPSSDVRNIAAKAKELGPMGLKLFVPPVVIGHDDDFPDSSGALACGAVDPRTVRAVPDTEHPGETKLVGDLVNVPRETAEKIRRRELNRVSAEVYDSFLDDFGTDHGRVLRRVALLGGEPSQVKRTASLPMPVPQSAPIIFRESPGVVLRETRCRSGSYSCHAERKGKPMSARTAARPDRQLAIVARWANANRSALSKAHKSPEQFTHEFAELRRKKPGLTAADLIGADQVHKFAEGDDTAAGTTGEPATTGAGLDRQQLVAAVMAAMPGISKATLDALSDEQLADLVKNLPVQAPPTDAAAGATAPAGTEMMDEEPTREQMIADLLEAGYDQADLDAATDEELAAAWEEVYGAVNPDAEPDAAVGQQAAAFSEGKTRAGFLATYAAGKRKYGARAAAKMLLGR